MQSVTELTAAQAAESRHSVRRFRPDPVPVADVREILRLTSLAPSAFNVQPWRFVVVQDEDTKARLRVAARGQAQVTAAPVVIALYSDMKDALANLDELVHPGVPAEQRPARRQGILNAFANKSDAEREAWGAAQSGIALGFLLLVAESMGYATSAMAGFDPAKVKQILDLPEHVAIPALVALGVADEQGYTHHRHDLSRIATFR
jgi:nitroreductase